MFSQYTWGQFGMFVLLAVALYYLVVGLLFYREDFSQLLKGKKGGGGQLAGATAGSGPPPLVRAKSAFVATPAATESRAAAEPDEVSPNAPEAGAAENLPEGSAVVVGGKLPASTATATGRDDSTDDEGPMASAASVATDEAQAQDENREEEEDAPNEALAALIRQKAHEMPTDDTPDGSADMDLDTDPDMPSGDFDDDYASINTGGVNIESKRTLVEPTSVETEFTYQPEAMGGYEPLADFNQPVASTLDIAPAVQDDYFAVDSVAAYISQVQAGEKVPVPAPLKGTNLAEQLALFTNTNTDELAAMFGPDSE